SDSSSSSCPSRTPLNLLGPVRASVRSTCWRRPPPGGDNPPVSRGEATMEPRDERAAGARDRDLVSALLYGVGLVASALLAYAFNAAMGRRLSPEDFGTFAALLAVLLALSGPTTALSGGAAMSAARSGLI